MDSKLEQKLIKDFPRLYADCYGDPRQTCMAFGFECGDGWFDLIYELSKQLEGHTVAAQVKEKFGGLRFYITTATDEIHEIIDKAEQDSYTICERCGKSGTLRTDGWHVTLCDDCYRER